MKLGLFRQARFHGALMFAGRLVNFTDVFGAVPIMTTEVVPFRGLQLLQFLYLATAPHKCIDGQPNQGEEKPAKNGCDNGKQGSLM